MDDSERERRPDEAPIRVVIVEDHTMVAAAIEAVLDADPRIDVVGVAQDIGEARDHVSRHRPDVVIVDYQLQDEQAPPRFAELRAAGGDPQILVLTGHPSELALLTSLDAGACGFISKNQPLTDLIDAVIAVADGAVVVTPHLMNALASRSIQTRPDRRRLSRRELEILARLANGATAATVAAELAISPHTLRNHLARASLRLGAHSRLELVTEAIRRGAISPPSPR